MFRFVLAAEFLAYTFTVPWCWHQSESYDQGYRETQGNDTDAEDDLKRSRSAELSRYFLDTTSQRMVILGGPGSGKTVLGWRIALDIADQRRAGERVPVVVPIGTWDPFDEKFDNWLRGKISETIDKPESEVDVSQILPILDGLDEYSPQLRSRALTILSGRELSSLPLILISRSKEYKFSELWRHFLTGAAIVQLEPLPADVIIDYLEALPRGDQGSPLENLIQEVRNEPDGTTAKALSSAFMLNAAGNEYMHQYPHDFLAVSHRGDLTRAEEFLAGRFVRRQVRNSYRWNSSDIEKWIEAIARRSGDPFAFRPNDLQIPSYAALLVLIIAAAVPATVLLLSIKTLPIWIVAMLAVAHILFLIVFSEHIRCGPTLDPRRELRLERAAASEKAATVVVLTTSLGFLYLMAPYVRTWIIGLGVALGALIGTLGGRTIRVRLAVGTVGAICGLALGWAIYVGIHFVSNWRFALSGIIVGAVVFTIALMGNFANHVLDGRGREGLTTAPGVAMEVSLPIALWAGSISAISSSNLTWFGVELLDRVVAVLLYSIALAIALTLMSRWADVLLQRVYYALIGVFPARLLDFLEDFSQVGVLRRVGYSYEFKHPAILRVVKHNDALADGKIPK